MSEGSVSYPLAVVASNQVAYVTGLSEGDSSEDRDIVTAAYEISNGRELWIDRYENGSGSTEPRTFGAGTAIAVSQDGRQVFVTGVSPAHGFTWVTISYNASSGHRQWIKRGPRATRNGGPDAVAISPDGTRVFAAGKTVHGEGAKGVLVSYRARDGRQLWRATYGPRITNLAEGYDTLVIDQGGRRLYATATTRRAPAGEENLDWLLFSYDARSGRELWRDRFAGRAREGDSAMATDLSDDGQTLFVTGDEERPRQESDLMVTVAYDAKTGKRVWLDRFAPPDGEAFPSDLDAAGRRGTRLYIAGRLWNRKTGRSTFLTVAYDGRTGRRLWDKSHAIPKHGMSSAHRIQVSPNRATVFVSGTAGSVSDAYMLTVSYRAGSGRQLWKARYSGQMEDGANRASIASDATLTENGRVFLVTGLSGTCEGKLLDGWYMSCAAEIMTVAYRTN